MIKNIRDSVARALAEDIGAGDVTADLIQPRATIQATVITRETMTMAGRPWFDQVMRQVDASIEVDWHFDDGDTIDRDRFSQRSRGKVVEQQAISLGGQRLA